MNFCNHMEINVLFVCAFKKLLISFLYFMHAVFNIHHSTAKYQGPGDTWNKKKKEIFKLLK